MRDPNRPYLPALRTPVERAFWGGAVVSGLILGTDVLPWPTDFVALLAIGIAATLSGWRIEGGIGENRLSSYLWTAIAAAVWLAVAFVLHSFPFGR